MRIRFFNRGTNCASVICRIIPRSNRPGIDSAGSCECIGKINLFASWLCQRDGMLMRNHANYFDLFRLGRAEADQNTPTHGGLPVECFVRKDVINHRHVTAG